ncbi:MAG: N-acetyltransferase [Rikenellaceae bacterium]
MDIILQNDESHYSEMAAIMCNTEPWITLKRGHQACLNSLRGDGKEVYTIKERKKVVGVIVLQMTGTFCGYLQSVCIAPEARGKGYGHKAIEFCEKRIFSVSPNFFLCVSSFNKGAQKLYFSLGFELIGEIKDFVIEGYSELLLRKSIGSFTSFKPKQ